jgi:hypothetical protein
MKTLVSCLSFSPIPSSEKSTDAPHRLHFPALAPAKNPAQYPQVFHLTSLWAPKTEK